jgi:hypothetical protein
LSPASAAKVNIPRHWRVPSPAPLQHHAGNADAAVELITGIKKQRTPASGKKEKAPLLGKPQQQQPAAGAASPKIKPRGSPKIESKGGIMLLLLEPMIAVMKADALRQAVPGLSRCR